MYTQCMWFPNKAPRDWAWLHLQFIQGKLHNSFKCWTTMWIHQPVFSSQCWLGQITGLRVTRNLMTNVDVINSFKKYDSMDISEERIILKKDGRLEQQ